MALSKSAIWYRTHKASRDAKKKYDTEYGSTPERRKYRSELSVARHKRKLRGNPKDLSHGKNGKLILESRAKNRGRQGSGGGSTLR